MREGKAVGSDVYHGRLTLLSRPVPAINAPINRFHFHAGWSDYLQVCTGWSCMPKSKRDLLGWRIVKSPLGFVDGLQSIPIVLRFRNTGLVGRYPQRTQVLGNAILQMTSTVCQV